jgi:hypothetical protein
MWFIYALGGGWGHLTRAAALARYAPCPVRILTNSPYASLVSGLDIVAIDPGLDFDNTRRAVLAQIERAQPSLLIVDTFPRGLGGELEHYTAPPPRVLVQRDIETSFQTKIDEYVLNNYELIVNPGVRHWPAVDLIAQARLVIGGAGYNTVHECAALNVPLVARPWPRKYDRQWLRAKPRRRLRKSTVGSCSGGDGSARSRATAARLSIRERRRPL